ncbi:glutaminase A [Propioniciclava soli]|uniref:glutaminase A n=1 Tax=Propioniciclava soli TaxID=2775081 RepID=UPI001E3E298E|nr:glutaminase A [Propioniciclava soli]
MQVPVDDYLAEVLAACRQDAGELNSSIPELARADPDQLAVAVCVGGGRVYAAGDAGARFSIQSLSKPFVYALALRDHGVGFVESKVDVEPSGDPFNEISVEEESGRPRNPMINIGALTVHALVGEERLDAAQRFERVRAGLSAFAGRELEVDEAVFTSELDHAHRNLALAHLVRSREIFTLDPHEVVEGYSRQCSLVVDTRDLAVMGMTLASAGRNPLTGEQVVSEQICRQVLSVMTTCGMYNAAGDWMTDVGIPAKSGVSGGVLGALPGQAGIGAFSPRLDAHGNSTRAVAVCERLSADLGLHLMSPPADGDTVSAAGVVDADGGEQYRAVVQGALHFTSAERMLAELSTVVPGSTPVTLDVSRVATMNDVGRRMLGEAVRRLTADGHRVDLVDPHGLTAEVDTGDATQTRVLGSN